MADNFINKINVNSVDYFLSPTFTSQTKNYILAAPSDKNGVPTFRKLVEADIPNIYSAIHASSASVTWNFKENGFKPLSKYVTFDENFGADDGAPSTGFFNGFISSYDDYLASFILNKHLTDEWYVGYEQYPTSNQSYTAPVWYKLAHSGNVETGDDNGQVKIAGVNISVKGLGAAAYREIYTLATAGNSGWATQTNRTKVPDMNFIAYWDGSYGNNQSNLKYYKGGAFGTMAKETATDYAKLASPTFTGTPTAPTAANGTSTTQIATTEFVNNTLAYANAMQFKGTLGTGGTITALPDTHEAGDTYRVITPGTYAGKYCEEGTLIICTTDGTTANNAHWTSVETNEDGAVVGPTESTPNGIARFSGSTGRIIQNSGITIDDNGNLLISHATSATMTAASTNPKITFAENGTKPVHLIYCDQNSYRNPAGLKVIGGTNATPAWFEVEGDIYAAAFKGNADTATSLTNFVVSTYTLQPQKGVRIQYPAHQPVLISASRTNSYGGLILLGRGYGKTNQTTVRNNFTEIVSSNESYLSWSIPESDEFLCSIEIMHNSTSSNASIVVWTTDACTFTEIDQLTTAATDRKLLDANNYSNYALPLTGGALSGHLYLDGTVSASTSNKTQIIFRNNNQTEVAAISGFLGVENKGICINPSSTTTADENYSQIRLYLNKASEFPKGLKADITGNLTGTVTAGNITIGGTSDAAKTISSSDNLYINRPAEKSIIFQQGGIHKILIDPSNSIRPAGNGELSLGTENNKWSAAYATTFNGDLYGSIKGLDGSNISDISFTSANTTLPKPTDGKITYYYNLSYSATNLFPKATENTRGLGMLVLGRTPNTGSNTNISCFGFSNDKHLYYGYTEGSTTIPTWKQIVFTEDITSNTLGYFKHDEAGLTRLSEGSDLNSFKTFGTYNSVESAQSRQLINSPINNSGFKLYIGATYHTGRPFQIAWGLSVTPWVRVFNSSASNGGAWQSWGKLVYSEIAKESVTDNEGNTTLVDSPDDAHVGSSTQAVYVNSTGKIVAAKEMLTLDGSSIMTGKLILGNSTNDSAPAGSGIYVHDTRNVSHLPTTWGGRTVQWYFDSGADDTGRAGWSTIMHLKGYSTASYAAHQLSFNAANNVSDRNLYHRTGQNEEWQPWRTILDSVNYSSYSTFTGIVSATEFSGKVLKLNSASAEYPALDSDARIEFSYAATNSQPVNISYTPKDDYHGYGTANYGSAGLRILGGGSASPAWLEVEGNVYAAAFKGNADTATSAGTATVLVTNTATSDTEFAVGVRAYQGSGNTWTGLDSMGFAGILQIGGEPSRMWQIWARRGANNSLHWRNKQDDMTTWGEDRIILDSINTAAGANNNTTLDWGTTYTIAKINGTDIKFTTMAEPTNAATATSWANDRTVYVALGTASTTTTINGGAANAAAIALGIDGTLAISHGGTGITTTDPHKVLIGHSSGSSAAAPTWRTLVAEDLPTATSTALGIAKFGTGLSISSGEVTLDKASSTTLGGINPLYSTSGAIVASHSAYTLVPTIQSRSTTAGRYYAIEVDTNGVPFVNIPWTDTNTKVNYKLISGTTNKYYLMGSQTTPTSTDTAVTAGGSANTYIMGEGNLYTYTLHAEAHIVNEHVSIEYNETDNCLDFVFQ